MKNSIPLLTISQQKQFQTLLKSSIYQELHKRKLLSDAQLKILLRSGR